MSPGVFVEESTGKLVPMPPHEYEAEAVLQTLLETYPELLLGDSGATAPYLLIRREAGVPDHEGGASRWSLDHLFLDLEGVPTLVEVKRSTDTRIRREVVGQMLDYAANALVYWPLGRLVEEFNATCMAAGKNPVDVLESYLEDSGQTPDEFWQLTEKNLKTKRVRLLFVADEIPPELKRIIEFLNEAMPTAEVLGVEIKRFGSDSGLKTYVASTIGNTAAAVGSKQGPGELGPKGELYKEFWPPVMAQFAKKAPGWLSTSKKVPTWFSLDLPSGRGGIWFNVQFTQGRKLQVTLFLPHSAIASLASSPYTELVLHREAIEASFGEPLLWDPGLGQKRGRIAVVRDGEATVERTDEWPDYQDWFVSTAIKFRAVMKPYLDALGKPA